MTRLLALAALLLATSPAQAFCICLKCASGFYSHVEQISEAMAPTLHRGTCLTLRLGAVLPQRGEVIGFTHPRTGQTHIFRAIGLPGDTVEMRSGRLWLNGAEVATAPAEPMLTTAWKDFSGCPAETTTAAPCPVPSRTETLPGGASYTVLDWQAGSVIDDFPATIVPDAAVFVLGDNRDNAADSRIPADRGGPGMVPVARIIGVLDEVLQP